VTAERPSGDREFRSPQAGTASGAAPEIRGGR
jgi:hypothetical protein